MSAGFEDIKKECLLHRMFMRAGFDGNAGFQKDICSAKNVFAAIESISDVMEASLYAMCLLRVGEIVALVGRGQPHSGFLAGVEHDLLRQAKAEIVLEEFSVRFDINSEAIEVVEPPHIDAARGVTLRLVLQCRTECIGCLVPLRFVIDFDS